MASHHYEKWIFKTLLGLVLLGAGIFFTYFSLGLADKKYNWVIYALVSFILIGLGVLFLATASVHKVKADIRRKKSEMQNSGN